MTAESIEESLRALAELPAGRAKAARLETLATEAAGINNPRLEASALIERVYVDAHQRHVRAKLKDRV